MVLVVVVVALAGGVWLATRGGGDPSNEALSPVRFRRLPGACSFVPDRTVKRLVPEATTDHRPNDRTETQALAFCYWHNSVDSRKAHNFKRAWLDVRVSAYLGGGPTFSGVDQAKQEMNGARTEMKRRLDEQHGRERIQDLTGIGDEAFSTDAQIDVRVANVFFWLYYGNDKDSSQATLRDMRSAAHDIVEALNACTTCGH